MFQVIEKHQVDQVRSALLKLFSGRATEKIERSLTFPGRDGAFNGTILWRADKGIWAYFSERPVSRDAKAIPRWLCWFGIDPGEDGVPLTPNVEINLSTDPTYRQIFGRAMVGENGSLFLGHKGGLGGGQGGQMKIVEFHNRIRGFAAEPVLHADEREEPMIVIGAIQSAGFIERLRSFVAECSRLRLFARQRAARGLAGSGPDSGSSDETDETEDFSLENETAGTGTRRTGKYRIKRLHGRVVNALADSLAAMGCKGINKKQGTLRPDLFLRDRSGRMTALFEVKVSSDSQNWFTALGQLLVYGAGHSPRRILVAPAPLQNPAFAIAMRQLKVSLVTFREGKGRSVSFEGLEALDLSLP
jgi:hypothetical protein